MKRWLLYLSIVSIAGCTAGPPPHPPEPPDGPVQIVAAQLDYSLAWRATLSAGVLPQDSFFGVAVLLQPSFEGSHEWERQAQFCLAFMQNLQPQVDSLPGITTYWPTDHQARLGRLADEDWIARGEHTASFCNSAVHFYGFGYANLFAQIAGTADSEGPLLLAFKNEEEGIEPLFAFDLSGAPTEEFGRAMRVWRNEITAADYRGMRINIIREKTRWFLNAVGPTFLRVLTPASAPGQ